MEPHCAPNGAGDDDKVIVSAGRLAEEKNWTTLMQAFALAQKNDRNFAWSWSVMDRKRRSFISWWVNWGSRSASCLRARFPFEQIPAYLKAADLFAFASVTETQGLVTMEAMAAGLPVVAVMEAVRRISSKMAYRASLSRMTRTICRGGS
jgi:1,2-diacylglycerol 3-alpha-glucosyltransferase